MFQVHKKKNRLYIPKTWVTSNTEFFKQSHKFVLFQSYGKISPHVFHNLCTLGWAFKSNARYGFKYGNTELIFISTLQITSWLQSFKSFDIFLQNYFFCGVISFNLTINFYSAIIRFSKSDKSMFWKKLFSIDANKSFYSEPTQKIISRLKRKVCICFNCFENKKTQQYSCSL